MALSILVVPDKFKGTLGAPAAAMAIARGWKRVRPDDSLDLLPMSDGGDGFGEVTSALLEAKAQAIKTVDAAHRRCSVKWWWAARTRTAIVESAAVIGLAMLPPKQFHPFELDTFGLGRVLQAGMNRGALRWFLGIGGSATNDGGFGLARACGWQFLDGRGRPIERWTGLNKLNAIVRPAAVPESAAPLRRRRGAGSELSLVPMAQPEGVVAAVDVQNPLLGIEGATRVFGPQKGLGARDFARAERCLGRLAEVAARHFGRDFSREPGAGAAGGLGFGLVAFFGARLAPGFELFATHAGLEQRLERAQLVLTGEGSIDRSTLMGKGVGQIAKRCRELNIPCIGLGGVVDTDIRARRLFTRIHSLDELTTLEKGKKKAGVLAGTVGRSDGPGLGGES